MYFTSKELSRFEEFSLRLHGNQTFEYNKDSSQNTLDSFSPEAFKSKDKVINNDSDFDMPNETGVFIAEWSPAKFQKSLKRILILPNHANLLKEFGKASNVKYKVCDENNYLTLRASTRKDLNKMLYLLNRLDSLLAQEICDHCERNLFCIGRFPSCELKFSALTIDHPLYRTLLLSPQVRKIVENPEESCFLIHLVYYDNTTNTYKNFSLCDTLGGKSSSNLNFPLFGKGDKSVIKTHLPVSLDKKGDALNKEMGTSASYSINPMSPESNRELSEGFQIVSKTKGPSEKVQNPKNTSSTTYPNLDGTKEKVNKEDQPSSISKLKKRPPKYNIKLPLRPAKSSEVAQPASDEIVVRRAVITENDGGENISEPENREQRVSTSVCSSPSLALESLSLNKHTPIEAHRRISLVSTDSGVRNLQLCLFNGNHPEHSENNENFDKQNKKILHMTLSKSLHILQSFSGEIHMSLKFGKILYPNLKPEIYQFSLSLSRFYKKNDLPKSLFSNCITNSVEEIHSFLKRPVIIQYSHSEKSYDIAKPKTVGTTDRFLFHGILKGKKKKESSTPFFMRCTSTLEECCFFESRDATSVCNFNFAAMPWDARLEVHACKVLNRTILREFSDSLCFRNDGNNSLLSFNNLDNRVVILSVQRIQENLVPFNNELLSHSTDFVLKYSQVNNFEIFTSLENPSSQNIYLQQPHKDRFSTNYTVELESPFMNSQFEHNKMMRPTETAKWDLSNPQFIGGVMIENTQDWYTAAIIIVKQLQNTNSIL
ncbi:RNA-silencing factor Ers1 [Schizosaccharomyces osmophilus]|uniref:RNA-silencing factor Ers1 n=1 Tax=Schizosaccharomyces osmophilus TaxID=2545709 RepID=A0AAE9WH48_9SCHI|nr:RNA-silencing factor Ers1 [Schizosaccharomyces osmophilus]WBW74952.1 RNA-silencing factor Ers1 [Schizosaccharomyces osmophilus]